MRKVRAPRETRCRITSGGGNPRESATESKPPRQHSGPGRSSPIQAVCDLDPNAGGVRVKGWGKSPPHCRQRQWQGKPHREQDRIGMTRGASSGPVSGRSHPGRSQEAGCKSCPRGMAVTSVTCVAGDTEPGLQAGWRFQILHQTGTSLLTCGHAVRDGARSISGFINLINLQWALEKLRFGFTHPIDAQTVP